MNNKQLLDALDCIDDRFVAELVTSIKPPEAAEGFADPKRQTETPILNGRKGTLNEGVTE